MSRLLVTGARDWPWHTLLRDVLALAWRAWPGAVLVHGDAAGADRLAAHFWSTWGGDVDPHPARLYSSPRVRNQHMVDQGAVACLAFATRWASGTGMCARMARRAGIPTYDYGARTEFMAAYDDPALDGPVGPWGACPHCHRPVRLTDADPAAQAAESAEEAAAYDEWGPA